MALTSSSSSSISSSSSPSSSAVTIPVPGKSILKRPPPPSQSLFSRITRFLPTSPAASSGASVADESKPLKRAHFILPQIATVYPISSVNPPTTPTLKDERRAIEEREAERRRRVVRGNALGPGVNDTEEWWEMDKVESFYRECCDGCEEFPDPGITAALKSTKPNNNARSLDLSGVQLTLTSASILSDVFSIEWGLRKLICRECDLDEHILKPMLHALLIPGTLSFLSVSSNRRLKAPAFRLIGAYLEKAESLQFLDLSQNPLDKKSIEYIVAALTTAPAPGLASLRLDDCSLRPAALEVLARTVRTSSLRNISLRHNRITATGAVALALMIRDYPDVVPAPSTPTPTSATYPTSSSSSSSTYPTSPYSTSSTSTIHPSLLSPTPTPSPSPYGYNNSGPPSPASSVLSLSMSHGGQIAGLPPSSPSVSTSTTSTWGSVPGSPVVGSPAAYLPVPSSPSPSPSPSTGSTGTGGIGNNNTTGGKITSFPPPPRHPLAPTTTAPTTTYTPYVRRGRAPPSALALPPQNGHAGGVNGYAHGKGSGGGVGAGAGVVITTSLRGGVTAVRAPAPGVSSASTSASSGDHANGSSGISVNGSGGGGGGGGGSNAMGPSAALLDKVRALDALPRLGALRTLDLRGNDLRGGITYIAQVLKRNRTLKVLNLSENKLDVQCLVALAEALKYNSSLETLDLSKNPCCGPGLEGVQSLRTAFTLNTALKRLFLSATSMSSPGAIALAEFLPESHALLHLDLTDNALALAGVMALSKGLVGNHTLRCLDLNIPPGEEEFARMCRDILDACVRNTEEAERGSGGGGGGGETGSIAESARGTRRGVWGMIEDSELAKSIKQEEEQKIDGDILSRARACVTQMQRVMAVAPLSSSSSPSPPSSGSPSDQSPTIVSGRAKNVIAELSAVIQTTEDPGRLQELLDVNDELTSLLTRLPLASATPIGATRPKLQLQPMNGMAAAAAAASVRSSSSSSFRDGHDDGVQEMEEPPTTPRVDKGKGKAMPEPVELEKVLSPTATLMIREEEEEDDDDEVEEEEEGNRSLRFDPHEDSGLVQGGIALPSPTDRSRIWVEEEGEVFRKGTVLLGPEEMEGEFAGDELRIELLEAMVERPPPRPLNGEYGNDGMGVMALPEEHEGPAPQQPQSPVVAPSPKVDSPVKVPPPPRPYISRTRSASSSIMNLIAPTRSVSAVSEPTSMRGSPPVSSRPYMARSRSASNVETR